MKDFFKLREALSRNELPELPELAESWRGNNDLGYANGTPRTTDYEAKKAVNHVSNRDDSHPKHNGHEGAHHEHTSHAEEAKAAGNHHAAAMHTAAAAAHEAAAMHLDNAHKISRRKDGYEPNDYSINRSTDRKKTGEALEHAHHMAHAAAHFAKLAKDAGGNSSSSAEVAKSHDLIKHNHDFHTHNHANKDGKHHYYFK